MIQKIRDLLKPRTPPEKPWGLSDGQIARLRALIKSPAWPEYQTLLDVVATFYAEQLLQTSSEADIHYLRGYVQAIRKAGTLVDEIVQEIARADVRTDQLRAAYRDRGEHARSVLAHTPGYRR